MDEYSSWFNNFPAAVHYSEEEGRYLVATKDLLEEDVVLLAFPYIWSIYDSQKTTTCQFCFERLTDPSLLAPCPKCKEVFYCSMQCQTRDTQEHSGIECKLFSQWQLNLNNSNDHIIAELKCLFRVLIRKRVEEQAKEQNLLLREYMTSWDKLFTYRDYSKLLGNKKDYDPQTIENLLETTVDYVVKLRNWLGFFLDDPEEILDILLKNRRNSFNFNTGFDQLNHAEGRGLYIAASLFNHSCEPNVVPCLVTTGNPPVNTGPLLGFKALDNIQKGEKLSISYLTKNMAGDVYSRRKELFDIFRFHCMCPRCVREHKD